MTNQNTALNTDSQSIAKSKKISVAGQSRWQLLVFPGGHANLSTRNIRRDLAHTPNPPHAQQLGWTQQVGWHSAVDLQADAPLDGATALPAATAVDGKITAPKFLARDAQITGQVLTSSSADIDNRLEARLLELAQQLAEDIRGPLAASHQIINNISIQARVNSYLSMDDAHQLAAVSRNLELISQWTEGTLLSRRSDVEALEVIRSRFTPKQWRDSILGLLEAIAGPKNVTLDWIGWEAELPLLYLDSNHLTRAVLILVANAIAASEPGGVVSIRASWQHNVTGRLMIAVEDNGIGLSPTLMKLLNSAATGSIQPNKGNGLQAARRLINGMGGLIAAQLGPSSGTVVRISLPVDNYASMIRAWILQNATIASNAGKFHVVLFAVRCNQMESNLFNSHLQKSATTRQFVYRVADNRWLVLELKGANERSDSTLMAAAEQLVPIRLQQSQPWLSQSVFVSRAFALEGLLGRTDSEIRLPQLTKSLVDKFDELLSSQRPAIDRLAINEPAIPAPHLAFAPGALASLTNNAKLTTAAQCEPGAQTVSQIVKQWKEVQAKLARLNQLPAVNR